MATFATERQMRTNQIHMEYNWVARIGEKDQLTVWRMEIHLTKMTSQ